MLGERPAAKIWRAMSTNLSSLTPRLSRKTTKISFKLFQLIYCAHFVIKLRNTKKNTRSIKLAVDDFFRRIFLASNEKFSVARKLIYLLFGAFFSVRDGDAWELCYCSGMPTFGNGRDFARCKNVQLQRVKCCRVLIHTMWRAFRFRVLFAFIPFAAFVALLIAWKYRAGIDLKIQISER